LLIGCNHTTNGMACITEGTSFKYSFEKADAPDQKESQFYVMLGSRLSNKIAD
jgi:hypothetical protein